MSMEFKTIDISDRDWVTALLRKSDFRGCEYSFANNMAWRRLYDTQISRYKDFYISRSLKYGVYFIFPAGEGDYKEVFELMRKHAEEKNSPLKIGSVLKENLPLFDELYPNRYTVQSDESGFDYIYNAEDLRALAGKKYHGKRNHLNRFYENDWSFAPLQEKDFGDCIEFAVSSYNQNKGYEDESSVAEQFAINTFFSYFTELNLQGGVIRVQGEIQGFTIGEGLNSDTYAVHIEKANPNIQGAYAAVNHQFANAVTDGYTYINREEDLGLEGLRKSKRSYHPAFLLEKYTVTVR